MVRSAVSERCVRLALGPRAPTASLGSGHGAPDCGASRLASAASSRRCRCGRRGRGRGSCAGAGGRAAAARP
eukprot:807194-Alexandrium_andersonii.AAC.1